MIKVLHKSLNVLEFIARHPEGQTLSAVAAAIGEKATTTSNIVQVLAKRNYLERVDGKWKLGISAYMLTGSTWDYDQVICRKAEPLLRTLAAETKASAVLSVWRGNERYVLLRIADDSTVTVNREYPEARNVYRTATGMVLLAAQEDRVIRDHIAQNGIPNLPQPSEQEIDRFREELESCRQQGYYVREKDGIFEAAAPLGEGEGQIRTAVGIFLPQFRLEDREALISALLKATAELETELTTL